MQTDTATARAWIDELPGGEFFFASEVPGRPSAVRPLLSRLSKDITYPLERQMRGFYLKTWPPDDEQCIPIVNKPYGALRLAGAGGGGAMAFALHRAGWTLQIPCRYHFAVLGTPPSSPWNRYHFHQRSNHERSLLTWAEVTLIEAVRYYDKLESVPWTEALESLSSGLCEKRMRLGALLRPEELLRVSEFEQCQPAVFHRRMADVAEAIQQHIEVQVHG